MPKFFHQKQQSSYCRLHAVNNLIGREICSIPDFNKYCDELDKKYNFKNNCSKNYQEFYNNGGIKGNENIFGYVLEKKGINVRIIGFDRHRKEPINITDTEDLLGAFCLSPGHVWCVRYYDDKWYVIDSLNGSEPEVKMNYFQNKGLVFLFVYRELDIMDKLNLD